MRQQTRTQRLTESRIADAAERRHPQRLLMAADQMRLARIERLTLDHLQRLVLGARPVQRQRLILDPQIDQALLAVFGVDAGGVLERLGKPGVLAF